MKYLIFATIFICLFVKKNPSGSISIQIIDKSNGKYKVVETIACVKDKKRVRVLSCKKQNQD